MRSRGWALAPLLLLAAHAFGAQDGGLETVIQRARADAAQRLGVPAASLELAGAESVTWPDGSLGCPRPGMAYTQALVPGYRIRLRAQGQVLDYRARRGGAPVLCPASRSIDPLPDRKS
jgi:hypothetical protein